MDANWDLLKMLIEHNRKTGEKSDKEVIETFINGYQALNQFKNEKGEIDVQYALDKINELMNQSN